MHVDWVINVMTYLEYIVLWPQEIDWSANQLAYAR